MADVQDRPCKGQNQRPSRIGRHPATISSTPSRISAKGDDTQEDAILICFSKPPHDVRIRSGLDPLRDYIGIEEEIQSSILRALRLDRLMRTRAPRRGEEAKNSARLPLRSIFRSHSSADTTTAALRPRRVIVCGPSASAWSITALRCALALATAQVRVDLAMHCPQIVPIVHLGAFGGIQVIGRLSDRACLEYVLAVCGTTLLARFNNRWKLTLPFPLGLGAMENFQNSVRPLD